MNKEQIVKILQCCNSEIVKSIIQITKSSTEKSLGSTLTENSFAELLQAESMLTSSPQTSLSMY